LRYTNSIIIIIIIIIIKTLLIPCVDLHWQIASADIRAILRRRWEMWPVDQWSSDWPVSRGIGQVMWRVTSWPMVIRLTNGHQTDRCLEALVNVQGSVLTVNCVCSTDDGSYSTCDAARQRLPGSPSPCAGQCV